MEHQMISQLLDEVSEESHQLHEDARHADCMVCEVAEAINQSSEIKEYAITAIRELLTESDPATFIAMLAGLFCAGARYESNRAVQACTEGRLPS